MNPLLINILPGSTIFFRTKTANRTKSEHNLIFMSECMCHWIQRRTALSLKAKISKVECICITDIQGKYKVCNLKKKMYKFSTLFKIFGTVYYELNLKGFGHLEIFMAKQKAINLWSDLGVSMKKWAK